MTAAPRRLLLVLLALAGPNLRAGDLAVRLVDPPATGTVVLELYDSEESFADLRAPIRSERFDLSHGPLLRLDQVPSKEVALVVYFDENGNGRLDRNFIGIPSEPLGFSNQYAPKGPPTYERAAFVMPDADQETTVSLRRPLGERGRLAVGLGLIARSSPYRDSDSAVLQPIPALYYLGNRVQIFGPRAQVGIVSSERLALAGTVQYQVGVYEEDDSPVLQGLGDRRDTMLAGLAFEAELPRRVELALGYDHDALDRVGGGLGQAEISRTFPSGKFRFTPSFAVNWLSREVANDYFGVPAEKATDSRPAYRLSDTFSIEAGCGLFAEVTPNVQAILRVGAEWLDSDVTRSPIVEDDVVFKSFVSVARVF